MKVKLMSNDQEYVVEKVGVFTPKPNNIEELNSGEIGFIITGIKSLSETKVGDTICDASAPIDKPLPGFKPCLLYTSPSPRDRQKSRMPSSA